MRNVRLNNFMYYFSYLITLLLMTSLSTNGLSIILSRVDSEWKDAIILLFSIYVGVKFVRDHYEPNYKLKE